MAVADLPAYVREREVDAPRWVWDDTARWYPSLLAAGVRVERCHDLRLGHHLLRRAPAVDGQLLEGDQSEHWDRLGPSTPSDPALFSVDDTAEHLRADLEDARQLAAVAASAEAAPAGAAARGRVVGRARRGRDDVRRGALAGRRPRAAARRAARAAAAARRPAAEARGAGRRGARRVRRARASTPTRGPSCWPRCAGPGWTSRTPAHPPCAGSTTRASRRCCATSSSPTCSRPTAGPGSTSGCSGGRFRPSYQPAGSTTGRWSSNGGGALSFPVQVRSAAVADDGWVLVVADVAQLEPRVLAGMSGDRALARSARGTDLYQGMVDDGAVASRKDAKLGLLGAMYGATSGESGRMVAGLTRRYPDAFGLVEEAARAGERGQVVRTLLGRGSPTLGDAWDRDPDDPPADPDSQARHRRAYGRFTRNFVVQGTGAEWALCWIADLRNRLWRLGGDRPAHRPAAPGLLPPRRGRRAHPGRARRPGRRAGPRGGDDRSGPAVPRPRRSTSRSTSRSCGPTQTQASPGLRTSNVRNRSYRRRHERQPNPQPD